MVFNHAGHCDIHELRLGDEMIKRVKETKFLGLWVDEQLNWKSHLNRLKNKMKCGLGMMQEKQQALDHKSKEIIVLWASTQPFMLWHRNLGSYAQQRADK